MYNAGKSGNATKEPRRRALFGGFVLLALLEDIHILGPYYILNKKHGWPKIFCVVVLFAPLKNIEIAKALFWAYHANFY